MKNCPVCNELLGDNVEICYKCKHKFQEKIFICSKCGKALENERSTCECGGWAVSPMSKDCGSHVSSLYNWTREELKSKAKSKLLPSLLLAVIACLLISLFSNVQLSSKRPLAYQKYDMNDNFVTYIYDYSAGNFKISSDSTVPAVLNLRIGWKTFTLIKNDSYSYISGLLLYIFIIQITLAVFIVNPYKVGVNRFFMANIYGKTDLRSVLYGFRSGNYLPVVGKMLLKDIKIFLWSLLLVIPGIVKSYEYMMVPYLLSECPGMSADQAFLISREMMNGNKWSAFVLDLSFLLWDILSILTLGLAEIVWVAPYKQAAKAELYDYFRRYYLENGLDSSAMLKGYAEA